MTIETFSFPMHTVETRYPASGMQIKFGNAYTFASEPDSPDDRSFILRFQGFKYFVEEDGVTIDVSTNAAVNNMGTIEAFYQAHRLWRSFTYPHRVYGDLICKFSTPLAVPEGIRGGGGLVGPFELNLIEQP